MPQAAVNPFESGCNALSKDSCTDGVGSSVADSSSSNESGNVVQRVIMNVNDTMEVLHKENEALKETLEAEKAQSGNFHLDLARLQLELESKSVRIFTLETDRDHKKIVVNNMEKDMKTLRAKMILNAQETSKSEADRAESEISEVKRRSETVIEAIKGEHESALKSVKNEHDKSSMESVSRLHHEHEEDKKRAVRDLEDHFENSVIPTRVREANEKVRRDETSKHSESLEHARRNHDIEKKKSLNELEDHYERTVIPNKILAETDRVRREMRCSLCAQKLAFSEGPKIGLLLCHLQR
jgi:hypothetical protein